MDPQKQIADLREQVEGLQKKVDDLFGLVYKNNFGSTQTFSKDSIFTARLNVPSYTVAPTVAEVNDVIGVSGVLYICTSVGPVVFTKVGAQ